MLRINYTAVLVSAILYWMLGALWYSPLLFAGKFIELTGWTPQQLEAIQAAGTGKLVAGAFISSLVLAYVLAHFVRFTRSETALDGARTGFWLCLGFVLTSNLETVLFENRPLGLYLINNGYHLAGFLMMGALLGAWKRRESPVLAYES
ncbi:MAG TPA: DUF1761 domain-containing protein [Pyrinomonadaceae bacterium]|nr:DUF1761 domain-containing protein [Pyrinomonadaceae bacterium]